jgi:hypothetical protein
MSAKDIFNGILQIFAFVIVPMFVMMMYFTEHNKKNQQSVVVETPKPLIAYRISFYNGGKVVNQWVTLNKPMTTGEYVHFSDENDNKIDSRIENYSIEEIPVEKTKKTIDKSSK